MSDDLRLRVALKVDELADLIHTEPDPRRREQLHSLAVDDLFDRMQSGTADASSLARAFARSCRDFWRREGEFSVKVPERPSLRLVSEDEFEQMAYPHGRGVA